MSAIRLLQAERKEEIQHLHRQFMSGGILQRELWEEAEKFLIQREIYDVILAEEQDLREYKQTLLDSGNYTKKQVKEQSSALRKIQKYWIETEYGELLLTECSTDNGYSILKEGIMITINSTTETIIPSVAGTTGLEAATDAGQAINKNYNGGIVDAEGVNVSESKGVQRLENANGRTIGKTDMYEGDKISASASVDGIDAAMSDADGSVNARVNLNILNSKTFLLPQTGGTGLYAATIIGAIAIGLGFVLTRKKRQRA